MGIRSSVAKITDSRAYRWVGHLGNIQTLGGGVGLAVGIVTTVVTPVVHAPWPYQVGFLVAFVLIGMSALSLLVRYLDRTTLDKTAGAPAGESAPKAGAKQSALESSITVNIGSVEKVDFSTPLHLAFQDFGNISTSSVSAIAGPDFEALMVPRGTISKIRHASGPPRIAPPSKAMTEALESAQSGEPTAFQIQDRVIRNKQDLFVDMVGRVVGTPAERANARQQIIEERRSHAAEQHTVAAVGGTRVTCTCGRTFDNRRAFLNHQREGS